MSNFGKNIKKIRTVKNLSQTAFAEIFGITRASVGAYEEGRAEAKIDTIIEIAAHFNLTLDQLLVKNLTVNEILHFEKHHNKIVQVNQTEQNTKSMFIPVIDKDNYWKYPALIQKGIDYGDFPQMHIPNLNLSGLIAFSCQTNEMILNGIGLHIGDLLLSRKIPEPSFDKLFIGCIYIVITKEKILLRRLVSKLKNLYLEAENIYFEKESLEISNIVEIFEVIGIFTLNWNQFFGFESRIRAIEKRLDELIK